LRWTRSRSCWRTSAASAVGDGGRSSANSREPSTIGTAMIGRGVRMERRRRRRSPGARASVFRWQYHSRPARPCPPHRYCARPAGDPGTRGRFLDQRSGRTIGGHFVRESSGDLTAGGRARHRRVPVY
jgi:hypothetical protein